MIDQYLEPSETAPDPLPPSYSVRQNGKRRGGWQETKRLSWAEVREIRGIAGAARRARKPLNVLATIRAPLETSDAVGKREISKEIGHLGEALKRRGQEHVAVTVYEKAPHLHAHHLLHVDPRNDDVIARRVDGDGVFHARRAIFEDVSYITKQRVWLGPAIEKKKGLPHQAGAPILGKRWTSTAAARALVEPRAEAPSTEPRVTNVSISEAAAPAPVATTLDLTGDELQLSLFPEPDLPCIVIPFGNGIEVRQARERARMTQEVLTARLGLRDRSHVANVERGHDRLSPQRRRLLQHIIETVTVAA